MNWIQMLAEFTLLQTRLQTSNRDKLVKLADDLKLNLIGMIPLDPKIEEMDIKGIPLFEISDDSVAAIEIEKIVQKLGF